MFWVKDITDLFNFCTMLLQSNNSQNLPENKNKQKKLENAFETASPRPLVFLGFFEKQKLFWETQGSVN